VNYFVVAYLNVLFFSEQLKSFQMLFKRRLILGDVFIAGVKTSNILNDEVSDTTGDAPSSTADKINLFYPVHHFQLF